MKLLELIFRNMGKVLVLMQWVLSFAYALLSGNDDIFVIPALFTVLYGVYRVFTWTLEWLEP